MLMDEKWTLQERHVRRKYFKNTFTSRIAAFRKTLEAINRLPGKGIQIANQLTLNKEIVLE